MTHVTVVIPALDATATLSAQLTALQRQQSDVAFEVIVVDNGSTDGTAQLARSFDRPDFPVRVVTEHRRGINYARNSGVGAAEPGIVLLCDADDEVHDGWVHALSSSVDEGHWAGGRVDYTGLNSEQTRLIWGAPASSTHRVSEPYVDNTFGGNCGFTTRMWIAIGGFDVRLSGAGGDENEMFMRAREAGYQMRWVPEALVDYRLRPGLRNLVRDRYRRGRHQTRWEKTPGGAHLAGTMRPIDTLGRMAKLVILLPAYAWTPQRRYQWVGSFSRHAGRLVGWWRHRVFPSVDASI